MTAAAAARPAAAAGQRGRTARPVLVLGLIAAVIVADQAVKWWAWRHVPWARINSGGDILVGHVISAWYAGPVTGALLDVLDFGVLSAAAWTLARCRASIAVVVPGTLMTAGWISNLLDRLGAHYWTAPGSVRGVVDFIHVGGSFYNVADCFIITCTPLFLLALAYQGAQAARRLAGARNAPPSGSQSIPRAARGRGPARQRLPIAVLAGAGLAGAGLVTAVTLGAANYAGVTGPPASGAAGGHARPVVTLARRARQPPPAGSR